MMRNLILTGAWGFAGLALAQNPVQLQTVHWASGLPGVVDLVNAGDDRLFAVQQQGIIRIISDSNTVVATPFLDIQGQVNDTFNEQGLLGLAFDPDHANNGYFYVHYTAGAGNGTTRVSRFALTGDPNMADPASEVVLYEWPQPFSNHNGGDLDFGPDGNLYIALGDGGDANDPQNNSQDLSDPLGDILRIHPEDNGTYTIPSDNPWVGVQGDTLPEIWASGLRNPWRIGFDRLTGDLWIGDVGQNAYEEIDFWPAGDNSGPNFGWRCYEANDPNILSGCLPASAYVFPVTEHDNVAIGGDWCSSVGGRVYRGAEFPRLSGRYIYTDYCAGDLWMLSPDGNGGWIDEVGLNTSTFGSAVIGDGADGSLFLGNESNGTVRKIVDRCPMPAPTISVSDTVLSSTMANGYQWYLNGAPIAGATSQTYTPMVNGDYHVVGTFANSCVLSSDTLTLLSVSISEQATNGFALFPVPANDILYVQAGDVIPTGGMVLVMDAMGRVAASGPWGGGTQVALRTTDLAPGTYQVLSRASDGTIIRCGSTVIRH
ncbi:MAG: PQQ-dependent sugar dehydrogenase [Flavobacteriales bacterium]|nr:PQQ-dependent sugar dehydrogenase [Flavobacteriales bacterium]